MGQHFLFQAVNSLHTDAQRVIAAECQMRERDTTERKKGKNNSIPFPASAHDFQQFIPMKRHSAIIVL